MTSAIASVPTRHGSKYLQQLCKHWSHGLEVEYDAARGTVLFPKGHRGADYPGGAELAMGAGEETLEVRVGASSAEHLEAMKGVVASHLDRFAFREAPLPFDWKDED